MFKMLEANQNGLVTPKSYEYAITNLRMCSLSLSKHQTLEAFHHSPVNSMDLETAEERFLLSASKDGSICIHDLENSTKDVAYQAKVVREVPSRSRYAHKYCVTTVQFYPNDSGVFTTSGMDCELRIWDTNCMKPDLKIHLHHKILSHHLTLIPSVKELIAVGMNQPHVVLVDPRKGGVSHELRNHQKTVECVHWSPSHEHILATGGGEGRILLWDIRAAQGPLRAFDQHNGEGTNNSEHYKAHEGAVNSLRFTDDGLHLVSIGVDNAVRLWDVVLGHNTLVNFGVTIRNCNTNFRKQRALEICSDTNPPVLFVPSTNFILMTELMTGEHIRTLVGHFGSVNSFRYRSSHHQLISAGNDNNTLLWTPDTEAEEVEHEHRMKGGGTGLRRRRDQDRRPSNAGSDQDNWSSDES